jgi:hypothetical protein
MQTREILHEQWRPFFNDFTQLYHGAHVNVETTGEGGIGVKLCLRDLPLVGIVSAGLASGEDEWIEIIAGGPSRGAHATHSIAKPSSVQLAEETNGQAVALQIGSTDGRVTMIRFEPSRENLPPGFKVS